MLALALRCDDKKVAKERQCYRRYIIAFEHVSPVCRLTLEDEMVLLNSRYGFSDDEDPIYKERRTMLLKVQASGRPRGGAAVLKSPDADGGGGDGETVAAALIAHRNGGAISQLFDDTYCKAKLVEAHAAFEARAPPPVPAAPFVNIASLKENVKEGFGGFSVRNDDMDVAAADGGSGSGAWGSGGSSSGWGTPTSSWSVELGWLVPDVPSVALGGTRGTTPGTRVTGFELEIVELNAEVAKLDDDRIAALGGGDDAPAATERWTVKRDIATTSSSHLDAAKKGGQKGGYWPDAEQAALRRYELCALFDRFVAKESKAAAKETAAADGVSTSDSDQPDSRTLSTTSARAAIAKRLLDTGVDKEKRDIGEAEFAQWCAAARVEAFSTSSIDATVALAPRRITFSDFFALCTDGVAWATGSIGGAPGQVPPLQRVTVEFLRSDHA